MTARFERSDIRANIERTDMIEKALAAEAIEKPEATEPIEPMERTEPTDPIDSTDPVEPMDRKESFDHSESRLRDGTMPSLSWLPTNGSSRVEHSGVVYGVVTHLHRSADHAFTKSSQPTLELVAGMGVQGDAHFGATVQHRSRVASDATQPNLRQVHLLHAELFDELLRDGFSVQPGDLGENITTRNLDLLALPVGAVLRIGDTLLGLTGLRNPCLQIEHFQCGLLKRVTDNSGQGHHMAGVMAVVLRGGRIAVDDTIEYSLPPGRPVPLTRV